MIHWHALFVPSFLPPLLCALTLCAKARRPPALCSENTVTDNCNWLASYLEYAHPCFVPPGAYLYQITHNRHAHSLSYSPPWCFFQRFSRARIRQKLAQSTKSNRSIPAKGTCHWRSLDLCRHGTAERLTRRRSKSSYKCALWFSNQELKHSTHRSCSCHSDPRPTPYPQRPSSTTSSKVIARGVGIILVQVSAGSLSLPIQLYVISILEVRRSADTPADIM